MDFPSSKKRAICRVNSKSREVKEINGIPLVHIKYRETIGLPGPKDDTYYLVSLVVAQANRERKDLICPDTSPESVVRDDGGGIMGVRRFCCYWKE